MSEPGARPLPTGRWRQRSSTAPAAAERVRRAHAQTRPALWSALGFIVAAALAAALGASNWLALHLFLAGGLVLAISGVSLMLTVTWSGAPAPPGRLVAGQQLCVALGTVGVAAGRELAAGPVVLAGAGTLYLAGLAGLAAILVITARRGVERRFDPAVAAYVAAIAAGVAGVTFGVTMAAGTPSAALRAAHVTINLLGLIGLVIAGTLPYFAATVGRARMAPHATPTRLRLVTALLATALVVTVAATAADHRPIAGVGLLGYAAGILGVLALAPRPTRRQLRWAGPRLLALWVGALWWTAAIVGTAVALLDDRAATFGRPWLVVLVVAGYAQILWGSLAYLLPMLRGGGYELLGTGLATTRSWIGLAAANVAGFGLLADVGPVAFGAIGVWVLDTAWRAGRVGLGARARRQHGANRDEPAIR